MHQVKALGLEKELDLNLALNAVTTNFAKVKIDNSILNAIQLVIACKPSHLSVEYALKHARFMALLNLTIALSHWKFCARCFMFPRRNFFQNQAVQKAGLFHDLYNLYLIYITFM